MGTRRPYWLKAIIKKMVNNGYKIRKGLSSPNSPLIFLPVNLLFSHLSILMIITDGFFTDMNNFKGGILDKNKANDSLS